ANEFQYRFLNVKQQHPHYVDPHHAAVSSDEVKEAPTDYATGVALETTGAFALVSHFAAAGGVSEHCMAGFARCAGF
ncbi:hypothetical protein QU797_25305, partial [Escherichia coli]|nr:hypothetical protein [Escherichia coli]